VSPIRRRMPAVRLADSRSCAGVELTASLTSSIEHAIPGDYQLRALQKGWLLQRAWHRARLDLIGQVLPPATNGLILDAASGSGIVTWKFQERRIVSADMRVSAGAATRRHTSGARAVAALVEALPFCSGTFAQAYLLEAIEHLGADEAGARPLGTHSTARRRSTRDEIRPRAPPSGGRSCRVECDETRIVQPRRTDRRGVLGAGRRLADRTRSVATALQRSPSLRGLHAHLVGLMNPFPWSVSLFQQTASSLEPCVRP
jgi:hypothetical protein